MNKLTQYGSAAPSYTYAKAPEHQLFRFGTPGHSCSQRSTLGFLASQSSCAQNCYQDQRRMGASKTQLCETLCRAGPYFTRSHEHYGTATWFHSLVSTPAQYQSRTDGVTRRKQYNTKISKWRVGKNVKANEMRAIIRKEQKRKKENPPKETVSRVRKRDVGPSKIARFIREKGTTDEDDMMLDAGTFAGRQSP